MALLDTAATENFIHPNNLTMEKFSTIQKLRQEVNLAVPGVKMIVMGHITHPIKLGLLETKVNFLVSDEQRESLILGLYWIYDQSVVIDLPNGKLHAGKDKRTTLYLSNTTPERSSVLPVNES